MATSKHIEFCFVNCITQLPSIFAVRVDRKPEDLNGGCLLPAAEIGFRSSITADLVVLEERSRDDSGHV